MSTMATTLRKIGAVTMSALCVLGTFAGSALAQSRYESQAKSALTWMKSQQQPDGSFAGFGAGSTVDAALAIIATGESPSAYSNGGNTPITFLEGKVADLTKTPGSAGKLLIVTASLNSGSGTFGGVDLVNIINSSYDAGTGHYGQDALGHAFAMLGLHAAGHQIPAAAVAFLKGVQTPEGGWAFSGDTAAGAADTNTTAVVLQALALAGATKTEPEVIEKAITYLSSQQNADGGFPYQKVGGPDSESDVNSTAYVAQALLTLGNTTMGDQALAFIVSVQKPNGAFQWKKSEPDDNAGATYQAVPALLGASLAFPNPALAADPTASQPVPGMPTTGSPIADLIGALAGMAALILGVGVLTRRKALAR